MTDEMRAKFEVAFRAQFGFGATDVRDSKSEDGAALMGAALWAWEASREAVVVELGAPSHWVADYAACGGGMAVFDAEKAAKVTDPMCSKTPSYTIHALEKAGLKVAP